MKRLLKLTEGLLGVLLLVGLVFSLNSLFQAQVTQSDVAVPTQIAESNPAVASTTAPALTWEMATLDQIRFGEPRVVFTNTGLIKIHDWLPDNRRLLLEVEDPKRQDPAIHYRIVTLDLPTGEITEYGRRRDWDASPVWLEKARGVAFTIWNTWAGESPQVHLGFAGGQVRVLDRHAYASLAADPQTGNLFYLKQEDPTNTLQVVDVAQGLTVASPLRQDNLPWGELRVDPTGQWLASFRGRLSHAPLHLANRHKTNVTRVEFDSWWPLDGTWSPDGRRLALVLGNGDMLISISKLALLNPETLKWQFINLPAQFITELEWGPSSRFLLVRGVPLGFTPADPYEFWLVDVMLGTFKKVSYFPPNTFPEYPFMAWSRTGQLAWLKGVNGGFQLVTTQVSAGR